MRRRIADERVWLDRQCALLDGIFGQTISMPPLCAVRLILSERLAKIFHLRYTVSMDDRSLKLFACCSP